MANDTNAGLSSYIFSENLKEIMTATERLKQKCMRIVRQKKQSMVITQVERESGLGGADGIHGFEEYYNTTVSYIRW